MGFGLLLDRVNTGVGGSYYVIQTPNFNDNQSEVQNLKS